MAFVVRALALLAFGGALLVLGTDVAVRRRFLQPFGWWPRAVHRAAAPLLYPLERRLRRSGANPADSPLWLLGIVLVGGLLALGLVQWIGGSLALISGLRGAGPAGWTRMVIGSGIWLVMAAIMVRVIGSWLGFGRHTSWMRPVFLLTDWIIAPIARRLPPIGLFDLSPFVAYLGLMLIRSLIGGPFS
ncbi:MAG TPA: YggT family protein [Gemmatimonadales bacterium]|nr:YggT family protein [Gemmatimonadales bacterium]